MIKVNCIGYPRIGPKRELKNALEKYWKSEISENDLIKCANELKKITGKHKKIMVLTIFVQMIFLFMIRY